MKTLFIPDAAKNQWDFIEVHPVWEDENGNCDVCEEGDESFWSVYIHLIDGGIQCIADLPTKELAFELNNLIENLIKSKTA